MSGDRACAILSALNAYLCGGRCPAPGVIGECAAIEFCSTEMCLASVFIWQENWADVETLVTVCKAAGAKEVRVAHVIYCDLNGDRHGHAADGARAFDVMLYLPARGDGSPVALPAYAHGKTRSEQGGCS